MAPINEHLVRAETEAPRVIHRVGIARVRAYPAVSVAVCGVLSAELPT
jgi:hypothetical protein